MFWGLNGIMWKCLIHRGYFINMLFHFHLVVIVSLSTTSYQAGPPGISFIHASILSLVHSIIHPQGLRSVSNGKKIKPKLLWLILRPSTSSPSQSTSVLSDIPPHLNSSVGSHLSFQAPSPPVCLQVSSYLIRSKEDTLLFHATQTSSLISFFLPWQVRPTRPSLSCLHGSSTAQLSTWSAPMVGSWFHSAQITGRERRRKGVAWHSSEYSCLLCSLGSSFYPEWGPSLPICSL